VTGAIDRPSAAPRATLDRAPSTRRRVRIRRDARAASRKKSSTATPLAIHARGVATARTSIDASGERVGAISTLR